MGKSDEEAIAQFNKYVNMSPEELQKWLDNPQSKEAGTGVGIESGHKIVNILRKNPSKDPKKYDEEDIQHIHKVAGYISRHLAQEDHLKDTKTPEELEKTKSTISLKNWGHNPMKNLHPVNPSSQKTPANKSDDGTNEAGRSKRKRDEEDTEGPGTADADGDEEQLDGNEEEEEEEEDDDDDDDDDGEDDEDYVEPPKKKTKADEEEAASGSDEE